MFYPCPLLHKLVLWDALCGSCGWQCVGIDSDISQVSWRLAWKYCIHTYTKNTYINKKLLADLCTYAGMTEYLGRVLSLATKAKVRSKSSRRVAPLSIFT